MAASDFVIAQGIDNPAGIDTGVPFLGQDRHLNAESAFGIIDPEKGGRSGKTFDGIEIGSGHRRVRGSGKSTEPKPFRRFGQGAASGSRIRMSVGAQCLVQTLFATSLRGFFAEAPKFVDNESGCHVDGNKQGDRKEKSLRERKVADGCIHGKEEKQSIKPCHNDVGRFFRFDPRQILNGAGGRYFTD